MSTLNLNLLPSQAKFQAAKIRLRKKVILIVSIFLGFWVVMVATILILGEITKWRIKIAQAKFDKSEKAYLLLTDNIVTSQKLKYKAKLVGGVLRSRFEYNKTFDAMGKLFPDSITILKFDLKDKSTFILSGTFMGRENTDILEKTIANINSNENSIFKAAKLNSLVYAGGIWSFNMETSMK